MASKGPVVYIVIYSLFHHVYEVSLAVRKGLEAKGAQVKLFQVQETLSDDILTKMKAPAKPDIPIITVDMLVEPDAIIFGLPTRFGVFPAQMKALLDASGSLWATGALAGKFAGVFFSTASQHGGQETTALTAITYFAHHGMMYIPFGFANANLFDNSEVIGGSAYGAGTVAGGDGARRATEAELEIATNQGENFANILNTFTNGKQKMLLISQKQENNAADSAGLLNKENVTTDIPSSSAAANPPSDEANGANNAGIATTAAAVGAGSAAVATAVRGSSNTTDATTNGVTNASTDPTGASNKLDTAIGGVNNNIDTTVNGVNDRANTAATSASNGLNSAVTDTKNNVDTTVDGISNKLDTNNTTSVPDPASATAAKLPTGEEINISPNEQTNGLETNAKEPMVAPEILPDPVVAVGTTTAAPATVSATVGDPVPDSDAGAAVKAEPTKQETKPVVTKPTVTTEPKKKKPWFCCG